MQTFAFRAFPRECYESLIGSRETIFNFQLRKVKKWLDSRHTDRVFSTERAQRLLSWFHVETFGSAGIARNWRVFH